MSIKSWSRRPDESCSNNLACRLTLVKLSIKGLHCRDAQTTEVHSSIGSFGTELMSVSWFLQWLVPHQSAFMMLHSSAKAPSPSYLGTHQCQVVELEMVSSIFFFFSLNEFPIPLKSFLHLLPAFLF